MTATATYGWVCSRYGAWLSRANSGTMCSPCEQAVQEALPETAVPAPTSTPWLYEAGEQQAPPDGSNLKAALRAYRATHHLTQQDLADLLGYDQSYVSVLERGKRSIRDVDELRRVASVLGLPEDELGLLPVVLSGRGDYTPRAPGPAGKPQNAVEDQRRWGWYATNTTSAAAS